MGLSVHLLPMIDQGKSLYFYPRFVLVIISFAYRDDIHAGDPDHQQDAETFVMSLKRRISIRTINLMFGVRHTLPHSSESLGLGQSATCR
jgi:hypothetical protein